jgi:hypothetical protein
LREEEQKRYEALQQDKVKGLNDRGELSSTG